MTLHGVRGQSTQRIKPCDNLKSYQFRAKKHVKVQTILINYTTEIIHRIYVSGST